MPRAVLCLLIWHKHGANGFLMFDSFGYLSLAGSMLHGSFSTAGFPELIRTPGYPAVLIPGLLLGHPVFWAILLNSLLTILTAFLLWRVLQLVGDREASRRAVLLYGLDPLSVFMSLLALSDTLFCAELLIAALFLCKYFATPERKHLLVAAAALGGAIYTKPVALYLVPCLLVIVCVFTKKPWRTRMAHGLLLASVIAALVTPWLIRNMTVAAYPGMSSAGDWNLYINSAAAVQSRIEHKPFKTVQREMGLPSRPEEWLTDYLRGHPEQSGWPEGQIVKYWHDSALTTLHGHWLQYAGIHARGCAIVLFDSGFSDVRPSLVTHPPQGGFLVMTMEKGTFSALATLVRERSGDAALLGAFGIWLLAYYILAALGLRHLPISVRALFLCVTVYLVAVSGMPGAAGRYRLPIMPLMCISASGALSFHRKASRPKSPVIDRQLCNSPDMSDQQQAFPQK